MSAVLRKLVCERASEPIKRIRELLYNTELCSDKKPPEGVDHQGQCSRNIVEATSASLPDSMAGAEATQDGDRGLPRPPLLSIPADSSPRDAKGASLDALLALESLVTKQKEGTPGKAAAAPAKVYIPLHRRRKSREQTIVGEDPMALMDDDLERAFVQMDTNGDGAINPLELKAAFEAAGRPGKPFARACAVRVRCAIDVASFTVAVGSNGRYDQGRIRYTRRRRGVPPQPTAPFAANSGHLPCMWPPCRTVRGSRRRTGRVDHPPRVQGSCLARCTCEEGEGLIAAGLHAAGRSMSPRRSRLLEMRVLGP